MIFILLIVTTLLFYWYVHLSEKSRQIDRMFPGPFRIPFIGTLLANLLERNSKFRKNYTKIYNYRPYRHWFLNKPYIMISDCKTAKIIFSKLKFTDKADSYKVFQPFMGKNLFVSDGETWLKFRKHAVTALSHKALNYYLKIFDKNCDKLCRILEQQTGNGVINIHKFITKYAADNLFETILEKETHWQADPNPNPPVIKALEDISKAINWRIRIPILSIDWIFNLTRLGKLQNKSIQTVYDYIQIIVRNKKKSIQNETDHTEKTSSYGALTHYIQSHAFTDEVIKEEMSSVAFAGFESVSSAMCFAFYLLAKHPDIQEKVYKEVKTVIEGSNTWPDLKDLAEMVYTEQVLCETLRFYSPFPSVGRYITENLYLEKDQFIPKNTNVFILLSAIHKDPRNWPNPDVFDPDRFSTKNTQSRNPYTFVPFAAGPRKCIGYKFAMVEMKLTVSKIIHRFKIFLNSKEDSVRPTRNLGIVLTSLNGFNIRLQSRDEGEYV